MKRLVELDDGYCLEIDVVKLRRVGLELMAWLATINPKNDPHFFLQKDLPLVEAALAGELPVPYRFPNPHSWEIREGLRTR
jgi:hypothetical protein